MNLSVEDLDKIQCDGFFLVNQVDLSVGSYYYKFAGISEIFRELLGNMVFNLVGINCAKYEYIPEKKCLLSKDLNSEQVMHSPSEFGIKAITLYDVNKGIEKAKFGNEDKLKLSIEVMHFIDLLFSNIDRHVTNFGFYIDENNNATLVVFDNGCFLSYYEIATRPLAFKMGGMSSMQFLHHSKKEEAQAFIKSMSIEMKELAPMYLELFSPNRVEFMIEQIEKDLGITFPDKKYNMKKYKNNYNMVNSFVMGKRESFVKRLFR